MVRQLAVVALLALVFGGIGSSALLTRAVAQPKPLSPVQHEKRLGPTPTPHWYWRWLHWRLHDRRGNRLERGLRPNDAPHRVPHWAWRRLHFFLLARAERAFANKSKRSGQKKQTSTTTAANTTTTRSSSGSVYFNVRAKNMTELYSYETTPGDISTLKQGQSPDAWNCLCFNNNSMSLAADSTFGKAYKFVVGPGDKNPWNSAAPATNAASQVSKRRDNDLGKWDWYAIAVKLPSTWQRPPWTSLVSLGYETLASDQLALGVATNSSGTYFTIHQNSGLVSKTSTGFHAGAVSYVAPVVPVTYDAWQEFVIGVKWATDRTGAVEVYTRTPGSKWRHAFEKTHEPTYAYGTTQYGTIDAKLSQKQTVIDKIGLYFGGYSTTSFPTETVYESGLTRSSNLATAKSTLP